MRLLCCLLSVMVLVLSSCGDSPTPPDPQISQGSWTGTTTGSEDISFTVTGDSVTSLEVVIIYDFEYAGYIDTVTWSPANAHISSNSFSMSDSVVGPRINKQELDGTFTPPDEVNGEVASEGIYHPDTSSTYNIDVDETWAASPR